MTQDAVCKSENPIRPLSDDQARQVFPHSWNFPSQPSGPGTRGSLQVWAGFSKVNITFKTSTFHTWDLLSVNWILTGWGLDYVNWFNAWRAFGLFSLKLKCVCALMSVMIVDVVQEKRYRSDFWVQLQLRQQLCNFQNNDTVSISLQCCGGWGGFCREAVAQTLRREWSRLTTSRSIQFHAPGAKLLLALAAALFRVSPLVIITSRGKQSIVRFSTQPWSGPSRNQCQSPTCTSCCCSSFGGYGSDSRLKRHGEKTVEISEGILLTHLFGCRGWCLPLRWLHLRFHGLVNPGPRP